MKASAIVLVIIAAGLLITGCSKNVETQTGNLDKQPPAVDDDFIDQTSANPDIGTLDDSPVSEELPQ